MKSRLSPFNIGSLILVITLFIVIASVLYTNNLARRLQVEEQQRVQIWADATERLILADDSEDLSFYLSIIEANTTIPVYIVDSEGTILDSRNVVQPVKDPRNLNGPIELRISDDIVQYIYYDESTLLTRLKIFPYIEFGIIFLFVLIAVITLFTAQHSEQNRVWVGLSKETAHQLGTPISSLNAWQELLQNRYPNDELIPEMRQDIQRLGTIAERFSKIGSEPELTQTDLVKTVQQTVDYMRTRISNKVQLIWNNTEQPVYVMLNKSLFSWVLENLIKNALDAMNGVGVITVTLDKEDNHIYLDIKDTGRGIDRRCFHAIFQPGYTSKKRGWGLGLSLSKRIIEDYHSGKIFVLSSQIGAGTTFRIIMEEPKER